MLVPHGGFWDRDEKGVVSVRGVPVEMRTVQMEVGKCEDHRGRQ
jgi:hypothetical protein